MASLLRQADGFRREARASACHFAASRWHRQLVKKVSRPRRLASSSARVIGESRAGIDRRNDTKEL